MSETIDTLTEVPESVSSEKFVEVKYDDSIPNNVDLASDKQLQRAGELAPRLPRLVEGHGA